MAERERGGQAGGTGGQMRKDAYRRLVLQELAQHGVVGLLREDSHSPRPWQDLAGAPWASLGESVWACGGQPVLYVGGRALEGL